MKTINIVAGGPRELIPDLSEYTDGDTTWVGVDKGTVSLLEAGIIPQEAFGDFDSITEEELMQIQKAAPALHVYQAEKDYTDLELALDWALQKEPETIRMFGVTGGRADHFLGNIQLLYKALHKNTDVELIDRQNDIQMFEAVIQLKKKRADAIFLSFHLRKRQTA